jgi:periplasmic divalent cation tolerance protein
MEKIINVITTSNNPEVLEKIGIVLLEARLISCIQIVGPVRSIYWWKGSIQREEEWMGVMKTRRENYSRAQEEIRRLHPYETPQIEAFEVSDVLPAYKQWVIAETKTA